MGSESTSSNTSKQRTVILIAILLAALAACAALYYWYSHRHAVSKPGVPQKLEQVQSVKNVKDSYDLIVVGTDPEGIAAAVSGARNGLKTLLVDGRDRPILGGLMTLGWLNSIDMVTEKNSLGQHEPLNKGLFSEWFKHIEGDSFDVTTAANAFYDMVKKEPNIDLLLKAKSIEPVVAPASGGNAASVVQGVKLTKADGSQQTVKAKAVIDATQDGDIAAAAGAPFTYGRADMGDPNAKMPVTLVFKLNNVTPEVWEQIRKRLNGDNNPDTNATEMSAAGYGDMKDYPSTNKDRVAMRGLNIGRQNDNSVLINALQIFHVDGLDPKQLQEAMEIGKAEIPHVVDYMKSKYPEFKNVELGGFAPELYVRETRHLEAEYRLNILDVAENRDQWDRIAFGSYPVDIQRLSYADYGTVVLNPVKFAVPFRSLVPLKVDGLLVVGRAAGYDSLPHGSARVIPVGMAEGEAAGAAVKTALDAGVTLRQLSASKELIGKLQDGLNKQGMELKPFTIKPQPYMEHKEYAGLKAVLELGLVGGGYSNDFKLDEASNPKRMVNLVGGARKMKPSAFPGDAGAAIANMADADKKPLTLDQAAYTVVRALGLNGTPEQAVQLLQQRGLIKPETIALIANKQSLTNADTWMLIKDARDVIARQAAS
ncbi:hypothetical protein SD70_09575 [Gordoniibacillus kamchatkensis]|uniref:FAD-dependent oxidoreductase n=1 Tax=Gordoniibacillus kamchatkensis TaxID=1590651 RepID=A0ABR5AJD8_9BACL|nr:FAD-dependent oxidoreductase [Paenibacillus sp. VKM B-2647]KIL41091.1 hypothetical protein SD70_09575 [Paenibacillus sp. VKM B-2647]